MFVCLVMLVCVFCRLVGFEVVFIAACGIFRFIIVFVVWVLLFFRGLLGYVL